MCDIYNIQASSPSLGSKAVGVSYFNNDVSGFNNNVSGRLGGLVHFIVEI